MPFLKITVALVAACWSLSQAAPVYAESRSGALPDLRIARGDKNIAEAWLADATTRYRISYLERHMRRLASWSC